MNGFPRLLCLASLATAAFAQTPTRSSPPILTCASRGLTAKRDRTPALRRRATAASLDTPERMRCPQPPCSASNSIAPSPPPAPGPASSSPPRSPVRLRSRRTVIPAGASVNCVSKRPRRSPLRRQTIALHQGPQRSHSQRRGTQFHRLGRRYLKSSPSRCRQEGRVRGASSNPMNKIEMGSLTGAGAVAGAVIAGPEGLLDRHCRRSRRRRRTHRRQASQPDPARRNRADLRTRRARHRARPQMGGMQKPAVFAAHPARKNNLVPLFGSTSLHPHS